jgi:hypothetical protein
MSSSTFVYKMNDFDTMDSLIALLRFLETRECRQFMQEANRIKKRKEVTERFRNLLKREAFFHTVDSKMMEGRDFLYD